MMDQLPLLPLEKILGYLSLADLLKSRGVSRAWRNMIDSVRVRSLCYSKHPSDFIVRKNRLVSGEYAQNFICSPRLEALAKTFGATILSNLKRLRLCQFRYGMKKKGPSLFTTLNSFTQLEELVLFDLQLLLCNAPKLELEINLPMLRAIQIVDVWEIWKLTLNAPRLQEIRLESYLTLNLVHADSVEKLIGGYIGVKKMKKLKCLHWNSLTSVDSDRTLLSSLENLQAIHLNHPHDVYSLFEQRRRYDRPDLEIYYCGLLLNSPDEPIVSFNRVYHNETIFDCLTENQSRLADEIPFSYYLPYSRIESVPPELAINVVSRLTDLNRITVSTPVHNIERFFEFFKTFHHIANLEFIGDQQQNLFDQLPDHPAIQDLTINNAPSDIRFLFRLKSLVRLHLDYPVDAELVRKVLQKFKFLSRFKFRYDNGNKSQKVTIEIDHPKRFRVSVDRRSACVADIDAVIQLMEPTKESQAL